MIKNVKLPFRLRRYCFHPHSRVVGYPTAFFMKELLFFVLLVGGWLLLQAYRVPKFGVKTSLVPQRQVVEQKVTEGITQNTIDKVN